MENGYHLYDYKGSLLREDHVDRFKQFSWRPRPPTLLSKDEQKQVRRNLREYSKIFEQQDEQDKLNVNSELLAERRKVLEEWLAWRQQVEEDLREQRAEMGLPEEALESAIAATDGEVENGQVVEEIVEEIIQETEEVV